MNPKKFAQTSHRIGILAALLAESLDEIEATSPAALQLKEVSKQIIPICEQIVNDVYSSKMITSGTYFNEISAKVDTVIRKNFEIITH